MNIDLKADLNDEEPFNEDDFVGYVSDSNIDLNVDLNGDGDDCNGENGMAGQDEYYGEGPGVDDNVPHEHEHESVQVEDDPSADDFPEHEYVDVEDDPLEDDLHDNDPIPEGDDDPMAEGESDTFMEENPSGGGPTTCMVYPNYESMFNAYQEHAKRMWFSVIRRTRRKNKYVVIACDRSRIGITCNKTKIIGCNARINAIKKSDDSWLVSKTITGHNHELHPSMSIIMRAHRKLSVHMKRQLEANDIAGITPSRNIKLCEVQAGGPNCIGCIPKDCRNHIDKSRRLRLGDGDTEAIRKFFSRLQLLDSNFFHLIDLDDEARLRNVLWIHPRSRAAYEDLCDVVSFDTTYLVNRYEMPFGAFVGVNHHGQSILLGCALVYKEDTISMKWLFENWVAAMGGIHPKAILTDQAESIKIAIRDVMPTTVHRYCLWHILSKLPVKFKGVRNYHRARFEFTNIVYDTLTIEAFETKWAAFSVKYELENNRWMNDLFSERKKWVPVYLNGMFWAGMVSTQRSEGMHAYFDDYLSSSSSLKQFMEQYEIAISKKVQKEFIAEFESKTKLISLKTDFVWEEQFRQAYTNVMFGKVQDEIDRIIYCTIVPTNGCLVLDVGAEKYNVLERNIGHNAFTREFTYSVDALDNFLIVIAGNLSSWASYVVIYSGL